MRSGIFFAHRQSEALAISDAINAYGFGIDVRRIEDYFYPTSLYIVLNAMLNTSAMELPVMSTEIEGSQRLLSTLKGKIY